LNEHSNTFAKKLKNIFEKSFSCFKFINFFSRNGTIQNLFARNYKIQNNESAPGVYTVPCNTCDQIYVGQTCRNLLHRVKEHKYAVTKGHSSAIADHTQSGHSVCFENAKIIHSEHNLQKRLIADALLIRNIQLL